MSALDRITPVALVPYSRGLVDAPELLQVAATLQTQLVRDVNPIWGVGGIVAPFLALEDVPPGYAPLVIVDSLSAHEHGFHFAAGGQPIALIAYGDGWSVRASHELIETLCDPYGQRTVAAPSLDPTHGEVDYLVEVCDPCQVGRYTINDIPVSDFVTPHYYAPMGAEGRRFSYLGTITKPLSLLDGGYISWLTRPPVDRIYQAFAARRDDSDPQPAASIDIKPYQSVAPSFSRDWIDAHPSEGVRNLSGPDGRDTRTQGPFYAPGDAARAYGRAIETEIIRILSAIDSSAKVTPGPTIDHMRELLRRLANEDEKDFRRDFAAEPGRELAKYGISKPIGLDPPGEELPSPDEYKKVLDKLERGGFAPYFGDPDIGNLLATLGTLGTLGMSG